MKNLPIALLICAVTTSLDAQWLTLPTPGIPRTADGKANLAAPPPIGHDGRPDLTGLWRIAVSKGDLLDVSKRQPWLQALAQQRAEDLYKEFPGYQCLPQGPGYHTSDGMKRLVQSATFIAVLNEDLTYRQIFIDGRRLETDPNPTWMGYSVGRWEGNTLVVDSNGFNNRTWLNNKGLSHTESLRITERYRRPDFGHLDVDVTFTDSGAYVAPLHLTVNLTLAADTEMLEAVCENPHGQQHWVGKASDAQRGAVGVAANVLRDYAGVYKGLRASTPRTVRVTLVDDPLYVDIDDRGSPEPMAPQSESLFFGRGLAYQFVRDAQGNVTSVVEQHVSGSYTYIRQP